MTLRYATNPSDRWLRSNYRTVAEVAQFGAEFDAMGFPLLAAWEAFWIQSMEAVYEGEPA